MREERAEVKRKVKRSSGVKITLKFGDKHRYSYVYRRSRQKNYGASIRDPANKQKRKSLAPGLSLSLSLSLKEFQSTSMAKKRASTVKKKEGKMNQIDNIPNYTKQSRSPPPKRRTDFSPFFSSNSGSLLGLSCGRDGLSAISRSDDGKDEGEKLHEPPLVLCCKSWGNGSGLLSKRFDIPIVEAESVAQSSLADYNCDRNVGKDTNDNVGMLTFTPSKSQVTGRIGVCITPGNVVWAKTARQTWWPAELGAFWEIILVVQFLGKLVKLLPLRS